MNLNEIYYAELADAVHLYGKGGWYTLCKISKVGATATVERPEGPLCEECAAALQVIAYGKIEAIHRSVDLLIYSEPLRYAI